MNRRPLLILALAISSFALAACSDVTGPRNDDPCSGVVVGSGRTDCPGT